MHRRLKILKDVRGTMAVEYAVSAGCIVTAIIVAVANPGGTTAATRGDVSDSVATAA